MVKNVLLVFQAFSAIALIVAVPIVIVFTPEKVDVMDIFIAIGLSSILVGEIYKSDVKKLFLGG